MGRSYGAWCAFGNYYFYERVAPTELLGSLQTLLLQTGGSYRAGLGAVDVGRHRQSGSFSICSNSRLFLTSEKLEIYGKPSYGGGRCPLFLVIKT